MENIQIIRLINNEEIMADITEDDTHYRLTNPVRLAIMQGPDGKPSVGFAPFPTHAEQKKDYEISIAKKHVMYQYDPMQDYINNYNQIFGAGIVLPPAKQLITG
jgi:hypothetical protein